MLYTEVMANTPKAVRKIANKATLDIKKSISSEKRKLLGKPATNADRQNTKRLNKAADVIGRREDRIDDLSRRGQFEEAANIANRAQTTAGIRLTAMLSPKIDKISARAENPGPKSGFLSKAKKR